MLQCAAVYLRTSWLNPLSFFPPLYSSRSCRPNLDGQVRLCLTSCSYTQQLLLEQAVDGVTRDVALYRQTSQQIRTYLQSVPTIYLPSHDPEAAHRLATRNVALPVNA